MKRALKLALLFFLFMLAPLFSIPQAQAAPGDFLFLFGAQQHLVGATALTVDANGNVFVTMPDNVQVFNSSGIRIRKWGGYGSGDGQFSYPNGIAVDRNGRVYVADTGNERVEVFDSNGTFIASWRQPDWATYPPTRVVVNGTGQVYVQGGGKTKVFDTQGNYLREENYAGMIAIDSAGNIYVLYDYAMMKVDVLSPTGQLLRTVETDIAYGIDITVAPNGYIYIAGNDSGDDQFVAVYDSSWTPIRHLKYWGPYRYEHYWLPRAVAADGAGNVYTLDFGDDGLIAWDSAGNLLSQWWTHTSGAIGQLNVPQGLAFDSSGNLYETDGFYIEPNSVNGGIYSDRVQVFTADGKPLAMWIADICQTSGIAINGGGTVYVLDNDDPIDLCDASAVAQLFTTSGSALRKVGIPIPGQDFFGVAFDKSGNFLVTDTANSYVRVFDKDGNLLRTFGGPGTANGQFQNPEGIAIDGSGNIFVADSGNNRIQVFSSTYTFIRKWGAPGSGNGYFSHPAGIAVDGTGHVFVADSGNNRVQVFTTSGAFLQTWGTFGDDNGQFKAPRGVQVNNAGDRIYVADSGNNRIEVFEGYASGYTFSGIVREGSATGPALAGATVSIAGKTATTSSTGTFSITGIAGGSYTLTISKAGYATKTFTGYVINGNIDGAWFYLFPAGYTLSGTVRQGSTTGPVLPGATVSIAGKTATTSSTGTFSLTGIPAGTYTLTISKSGFATRTITGYVINSNRTGQVFYLVPAYSISGTVRQGSATGPVLPGATVSIAGKTATTSSTGAFTITGIPSGTYTLTISKSGFATRTITGYSVTGNRSGLVFYLSPAYTISGTVRQGSSTGPVLPGATVSIAGKTATTGSTGAFTISGIPAGSYTLTISRTGYLTKTITGYVISGNRSGLVFYLTAASYSISGTVRQGSTTGPVLAGATVSIAGKTAITSSTGTFSITGIPAGSYTLTISKTGYVTKRYYSYVVNSNKSGLVFYLIRSS